MVFALTLVLAGLSSSFQAEAGRVLNGVGADSWVVPEGVKSVFTSVPVLTPSTVAEVARQPGVRRADPILVLHSTVGDGDGKDINLLGYADGGLGTPPLRSGRLPTSSKEVVVDSSLDAAVGSTLVIGGRRLSVVGLTKGMTVSAGLPVGYLRITDAQQLYGGGADLVTAVVTRGQPGQVPAGLDVRTREQIRQDLLRIVVGAVGALRVMLILLWCIAALVIGSVLYLSALERARDFAVYKATGWSTRTLAGGLALQAVLLSMLAAVLGIAVAQLLLPLFPLTFEVPMSARLLLPAVGLVVGLLASAAGLRRAVGVDPALAFGGQ